MKEDFILKDVPPHLYFWTKNGIAIRNLEELLVILEQIDGDTFRHHVNNKKNDFSEWIKNVFNDKKLAEDISKTTSKKEIIKILRNELKTPEPHLEEVKDSIETTEGRIKEILEREKEIEKREEKIKEIEERIEKKLDNTKGTKGAKDTKFFSKEFLQGIAVGLLISIIGVLVYVKFFS